jgi:pimeloyl-ACP methyl ester carboxylesterase
MANVRKGSVDVPHGEVHFRHGGSGPVVVLLHDAARSSAVHIPTIEWLGEHFTVLALDTPGCGLSTPLPIDRPTIPDFSRALAETLTALGIERCAVYGLHGGANIALQLAADYPARAALTVLDGLPLPAEPPDEARLARHLVSFEPTLEGDYIVRQWSRLLDLHRYAPWFSHTADTRIAAALPDDRSLHECATDLFMADPHWTVAVAAASCHDALPVISRLCSPTVFMYREGDPRYGQADRLPLAMPNGCRVARVSNGPGAWRSQLLGLLREDHGTHSTWQAPGAASSASAHWRRHRYVDLLHGQVRVGLRGASTNQPAALLLPDLPGAARQLDGLAAELATDRLVVTPELPGLGESDPLPSPTLGAYVSVLDETLDALGCARVDVIAEGLGTVLACAIAANRPRRVRRLFLDGVPQIRNRDRKRFVREYCPAQVPDRAGTHLLRLWDQLRTARMTWPWFERAAEAARVCTPDVSAEDLHAALVDAMKQPGNYGDPARAALDAALRDIARAIEQPVLALQDARDVRYKGTGSLKRRLRDGTVRSRPGAPAARAAMCREFLD